jgi:2-haloacid dehalogenase
MPAAAFDAMGTLFDLEPLRGRFARAGAPSDALELWFARTLHAAAALTLAGLFEPFPTLAEATLQSVLAQRGLDRGRAREIMAGLGELEAFPEARAALARLADEGFELLVLTNGSRENTRTLLRRSRLDAYVSRIVTTEDVGAYKPHPCPYRFALEQLRRPAGAVTLVAAHAWDVAGARAVGMRTIWISRLERRWPLPIPPAPAAIDLEQAAGLLLSSAGDAP